MIKVLFCLIALFLSLDAVPVGTEDSSKKLVFVGTIEAIAPDTGILSGDLAIYRLIKYRVERLCQGEYKREDIVVDHLIVTGKELEGLKVVNLIITELAVIEVTPRGLLLKEIASDTTIEQVRAATGAELIVEGTPATF